MHDPYPFLNILSPVCVYFQNHKYEEKQVERKYRQTQRKDANRYAHTLKPQAQRIW